MKIDMHHHFFPKELITYLEKHPNETGTRVVRTNEEIRVQFQQGWDIPIARGQYK